MKTKRSTELLRRSSVQQGMLIASACLLFLASPQSPLPGREAIVELLRSDRNEDRGEACLRLKRLGFRARELLLELETDSDLEVRLRAEDLARSLDLLERIPWRILDAYPQLAERVVGSDLAAARVIEALGEQAEELWWDEGVNSRTFSEGITLIQACPDLLRKEDLEPVAVAALREADGEGAKGNLCDWAAHFELTATTPEIVAFVPDPDPEVRRVALRALGRLRTEVGFDAIVEALEDPVPWVAEEAWEVLRDVGPHNALDPLVALLERSPVPLLAVKVLDLMELSGSPKALPAVRQAVQSRNSLVRCAAMRALATLAGNDSFEELLGLCTADCPDVRRTALVEAVKLDLAGSAAAAIELLGDPFVRVRQEALFGLARLGRKETAPAILRLLENPLDRQAALHALAEVEAKDAMPEILKYVNDPDLYVRRQAALAVEKLRKSTAR